MFYDFEKCFTGPMSKLVLAQSSKQVCQPVLFLLFLKMSFSISFTWGLSLCLSVCIIKTIYLYHLTTGNPFKIYSLFHLGFVSFPQTKNLFISHILQNCFNILVYDDVCMMFIGEKFWSCCNINVRRCEIFSIKF